MFIVLILTIVAMGNCIAEGEQRHRTTRELYRNVEHEDPTRSIMSANTDVTGIVERYRESLREAGLPQAPAPTEKVEAIKCPVNIRKESLILNSETGTISCVVDIDVPAVIEVRLKKKPAEEILAHTREQLESVGIRQPLEIQLKSDGLGNFESMAKGDELEIELVPLIRASQTAHD